MRTKGQTSIKCASCNSVHQTTNMPHIQSQFHSRCFISRGVKLAVTVFTVLLHFSFIGVGYGCNIDTTVPFRYEADFAGEYFGYTVLEHEDKFDKYLFIGAPRGNDEYQLSLDRPGKVYKCDTVSPHECTQLRLDTAGNEALPERVDNKNNQWLGVSLARQKDVDGLITTCGHRYRNEVYLGDPNPERDDAYPIGICYNFKLRGSTDATRFNQLEMTFPCLGNGAVNDQWRDDDIRWLSWCQAGIGAATTTDGDTTIYGAPGAYNWTGTVVPDIHSDNGINTQNIPERNVWTSEERFKTDYVGYAVTTGHFMGADGAEQGVAGAPRGNDLLGRVTLYEITNNTVYQELIGEPMSSYFGGALAAVDVNGDKLDDLLVGAPLFSNVQDEGKVYVYLSTGSPDEPLKLAQEIQGSKAIGSRFGTSISSAGDLNQDGYNDIIIGAPYEEDGMGAVYIYLGGEDGIDPTYSQRITGNDVAKKDEVVETFGISVHGSIDVDGNRYPDVLIGAYESDKAYLLRAKPLIQLRAWLVLTPQSVDPDPDFKSCDLNGTKYICIDVMACFNFTGLTVTSLLDIVYSIDVDEENVLAGIEPRFQIYEDDNFVARVEGVHGISEDETSCTLPYKAYLSDRARDLLAPVPLKLTYDVFKYDIQTFIRGDEPFRFPGGIPPLSDSYDCGAETYIGEVIFVQNCGVDAICQTDIQFTADVELPGGQTDALILGASPTLYISVKIDNAGEEAHQTILRIYHPSDMGYEGVELTAVSCLPLAQRNGDDCTPEVVAICTPQIGQDTSAIVECNLGNPMNAYNSASLRLRFDVSDIPWSVDRLINISMDVSTVSIEENLANNKQQLQFTLVVEADLAVVGGSQPEAVYYGYNATSMGSPDQAAADKEKLKLSLEAVNNFYEYDFDPSRYNQTHIGPAFNHEYQVVNFGRGRLPLTSDVTIQVPWRTQDEDMLLFIKGIRIGESQGSCNQAKILDLQRRRIEEFYQATGSVSYSEEEGSQMSSSEDGDRELGCSKAKCVEVTCSIGLLERDELVKITVEAVLWEYTFVTRNYGFVEVVTEAMVKSNDIDGIHIQPEEHQPDQIRVKTTALTGTMGPGSIPWWVILLAILIGLLFLIAAVLILWKLGFFKRGLKDEMEGDGYGAVPQAETAAS